jgi:demethylmenaquinone methyltransferase/2-methoxy-6-polyprenyl-1,4-benzoquinol methylase
MVATRKTSSGRTAVDKDARRIRRMFAEISPRYDFLNHFLSLNTDRSWRRKAARELALSPGSTVLDVCTGTGDLALELTSALRGSQESLVVGTDFTPEMVRIGERKRARRGVRNLCLLLADTLMLPFADRTFDAVTVAFGIRNLRDLRHGLREMLRVLRPEGQVAVLEFSMPQRAWLRQAIAPYFHRILPRLGGWISGTPSGREAYTYLPRSIGEFPSPEQFSRILLECGFCDVRRVSLTLGIALLHIARRPSTGEEL